MTGSRKSSPPPKRRSARLSHRAPPRCTQYHALNAPRTAPAKKQCQRPGTPRPAICHRSRPPSAMPATMGTATDHPTSPNMPRPYHALFAVALAGLFHLAAPCARWSPSRGRGSLSWQARPQVAKRRTMPASSRASAARASRLFLVMLAELCLDPFRAGRQDHRPRPPRAPRRAPRPRI